MSLGWSSVIDYINKCVCVCVSSAYLLLIENRSILCSALGNSSIALITQNKHRTPNELTPFSPLFLLCFHRCATKGSPEEAACAREVFQIRAVAKEGGPAAPEGCPRHPESQKVPKAGGEDESPGGSKLPQAPDQPAQQTTARLAHHEQLCQPQMSPLPALCTDKSLEGQKSLGDYSFVSDVISVAVLFDLPCPVRAHQYPRPILIHYFLTPCPLSNTPPTLPPSYGAQTCLHILPV